jgi:uncharacterized protein (TIRG00374 family)
VKGLQAHWERGLLWSVIAAAILYAVAVWWSGTDEFFALLKRLPGWLIPACLGVVFAGYSFRFFRWHWYLLHMGHPVPLISSFRIYFASLALSASPGRAGESIKSLLLKRRHETPFSHTIAGLLCERFTDLLAVLLLISMGAFSGIQAKWAIVTVAIIQLGILLLIRHPEWLKRSMLAPVRKRPGLNRFISSLESLIDRISMLLSPGVLVGSVFLAIMSWVLEGVALYWLYQYLGVDSITLLQAIMILAAADLIGAISFMPGGIGGAEVTLISLSIFYGAGQAEAVAATFLIRFITLWFGVGLGIMSMLWEQSVQKVEEPVL